MAWWRHDGEGVEDILNLSFKCEIHQSWLVLELCFGTKWSVRGTNAKDTRAIVWTLNVSRTKTKARPAEVTRESRLKSSISTVYQLLPSTGVAPKIASLQWL
jgi:hypothetical protein